MELYITEVTLQTAEPTPIIDISRILNTAVQASGIITGAIRVECDKGGIEWGDLYHNLFFDASFEKLETLVKTLLGYDPVTGKMDMLKLFEYQDLHDDRGFRIEDDAMAHFAGFLRHMQWDHRNYEDFSTGVIYGEVQSLDYSSEIEDGKPTCPIFVPVHADFTVEAHTLPTTLKITVVREEDIEEYKECMKTEWEAKQNAEEGGKAAA